MSGTPHWPRGGSFAPTTGSSLFHGWCVCRGVHTSHLLGFGTSGMRRYQVGCLLPESGCTVTEPTRKDQEEHDQRDTEADGREVGGLNVDDLRQVGLQCAVEAEDEQHSEGGPPYGFQSTNHRHHEDLHREQDVE